jgi:purine-nucleoside phosphorylase
LILGSGLGHLADAVQGVAIDCGDLPDFPHAGDSGHNPKLVVGDLEGVRVAVFGGRAHTKAMAPLGAVRLEKVLRRMLRGLGTDPI